MLTGEKPSTSFAGSILAAIRGSASCSGTGSCTSMPSTRSSALSSSITASSSAWVVAAGSVMRREAIPAASAARALPAW
jgi:hypothetical protein